MTLNNDKILILTTPKKREYEIGIYNYLKTLKFNASMIRIDSLVGYTGREGEIFYKSQKISEKYDVVIPFIDKKYEKFYSIVLGIFKSKGVKCYIDPKLLEYSFNHGLLMKDVYSYNISALKTYISVSTKSLSNFIDDLEFPLLIKIPAEGKNIVVKRKESLVSILDALESIKKYVVVKEIFPNMVYEEYLYIDGKLFGLLKENGEFKVIKGKEDVSKMGSKLCSMSESKIFAFSVLRDENGKAYLDDIYASFDLQKYIDAYGNSISFAISKSLMMEKGIKSYLGFVMNVFRSRYVFNKMKKEVES